MPVERKIIDDDSEIIEVTPDEILNCDDCYLPITDRVNGMDLALTELYWLNWGIVDRACYNNKFKQSVESGKSVIKLLKVFKKGQDVSEVRNHATLQMNILCDKCKTLNIVDTVIDRKDKVPDTYTCRACGNVIKDLFKGATSNDSKQV